MTILWNEVNKREDVILLGVDKKYSELLFDEELIQKNKKLSKNINQSLQKGKIEENEWNEKNKFNSLINNCVNVENNLKDINKINESIQKCNSMNDLIQKKRKLMNFKILLKISGSYMEI